MRLTNLSETEQRVVTLETALQDLLDHVERSMKNSETTQDKVKAMRAAIMRTKVRGQGGLEMIDLMSAVFFWIPHCNQLQCCSYFSC